MKTSLLFSLLFLEATLSVALGEQALSRSGPVRLTELQMDQVTAGIVDVSVTAVAFAVGDITQTTTSTRTETVSRPSAELGFGRGLAFACCGPLTFTDVSLQTFADGAIVITRTNSFELDTPDFSLERERALVLSLN